MNFLKVFASINFNILFPLEDLKMLRSLAIYASIAIENARSCSDLMHATEGVFMHVSLLDLQ